MNADSDKLKRRKRRQDRRQERRKRDGGMECVRAMRRYDAGDTTQEIRGMRYEAGDTRQEIRGRRYEA